MKEEFTLRELLKKNSVKKKGKCILCHSDTMWFHRKSYYHRKEMFPMCADCKKEARKEKQKPCMNHVIAFENKDVPEAKNILLRKCKRCGFWIKKTPRL